MYLSLYWDERTRFQFLGIPPKGEQKLLQDHGVSAVMFPISRDPPEGGTTDSQLDKAPKVKTSFQFLGIPPKGERLGIG